MNIRRLNLSGPTLFDFYSNYIAPQRTQVNKKPVMQHITKDDWRDQLAMEAYRIRLAWQNSCTEGEPFVKSIQVEIACAFLKDFMFRIGKRGYMHMAERTLKRPKQIYDWIFLPLEMMDEDDLKEMKALFKTKPHMDYTEWLSYYLKTKA
jgi:hypothetical protein